jgi:mannose/cellobiose epimerase-like protein (N-acyl-D-glucosamine 2-epimerase family)
MAASYKETFMPHFSRTIRWLHLPMLLLGVFLSCSSHAELYAGQQWLNHVKQDLAPFWYRAAAKVQDGAFPSFLCDDATAPSFEQLTTAPESLCPELAQAPDWVKAGFPYQWTRMVSRQTFAYGVIYHLTGDPKALELARQGVEFIRHKALLPDGDVIGKFKQGQPADKAEDRTSQDLAYAQLGMAFYYYLTRDPAVLADIERLHNFIFSHYRDEKQQRLTWYPASRQQDQQVELVSQLDPLNAYMVLLTPLLPAKEQQQWRDQMGWLAQAIVRDFYYPQEQRFFGYIHDDSGRAADARHADFGHTIKSYWMLYLVAQQRQDTLLKQFAEGGIYNILKRAYRQDLLKNIPLPEPVDPQHATDVVGWWGNGDGRDGSAWWEYAELDQAAATLGLQQAMPRQYLYLTWPSWFSAFVDKKQGEVRGWIGDRSGPKVHLWKNGYHSLEHALIGYLTGNGFQHQTMTLYFATPLTPAPSQPIYYYHGDIVAAEAIGTSPSGLPLWQATIKDLH